MNRSPVPHIDFCKSNLCTIEYAMLKLLADMGMKNKLFLVTGVKTDSSKVELIQEKSHSVVDNLVSFHQNYLDYKRWVDTKKTSVEDVFTYDRELSDVDPSYAEGSIYRPEGLEGVFVVTFADPETVQAAVLRDACLRCHSTETDTLLVELGNLLKGSLTVCTGDSDIVAVMTACGCEGITLRLDNKSYHEDRDMHMSRFGELLFSNPDNLTSQLFRRPTSSDDRLRLLFDITEKDECLLSPRSRMLHDTFEAMLDEHRDVNGYRDFKETVARYLYLGGIRGSLYSTFLTRLFDANTPSRLTNLGLAVTEGHGYAKTVCYIFETLCPTSSESPTARSESDSSPSTGEKRKISSLGTEAPKLDLDNCGEVVSKDQKQVLAGLKRLSKAYINGTVPMGSHGRFLRLTQAGRYLFMQVKGDVFRDEMQRLEKLFFMALCGTITTQFRRDWGSRD